MTHHLLQTLPIFQASILHKICPELGSRERKRWGEGGEGGGGGGRGGGVVDSLNGTKASLNLLGELVQLFVLITSKWERLQHHNADFVKLLSLNCGSNECINIWLNLSLGTVKKKLN